MSRPFTQCLQNQLLVLLHIQVSDQKTIWPFVGPRLLSCVADNAVKAVVSNMTGRMVRVIGGNGSSEADRST